MFGNRVENYVRRLIGKRKPRKVLVNMIYYPDEAGGGSWADGALGCLCYDQCPGRLQTAIRAAFEHGTKRISIPGTEVVPVPLFEVLNSKDSGDYLQRVEPSVQGGRKMARRFVEIITGRSGDSDDKGAGNGFEAIIAGGGVIEETIPLGARS